MKKKLLLSVAVLFSSMLGFAQNSLSMDDVKIAPGQTAQVSVNLNNSTAYTAFQFDMTLPEGITVKEATLADRASGHTLKTGTVNGKYRVLAYSYNEESKEGNKPITGSEGAIVNLTLEAGESVAEGATIVIDAGNADQEGGQVFVEADGTTNYSMGQVTAAVTASEGVDITVPDGKKLMMVSDKALDFTSMESKGIKAYICTGYEVVGDKNRFWLTRVNDVPANTPIMVKADAAGDYTVPFGASTYCYPKSFLSGDATNIVTVDYSADYKYFGVSKSSGNIGSMSSAKQPTVEAGKAFFQVPATIASNVADSKQEFTLGKGGRLATVSDYDLDFTELEAEGVKAYTVTGFDKNRKVWMTQVSNVNAGTPFVLRGSSEQKCEVPSVAGKAAYVNMLDANTSADAVTVSPTIGENTVYVLSLGKGTWGTLANDWSAVKGKAWMLVPTTFHNSLPAATRGNGQEITDQEAEVICIEVRGIGNLDDDDTTGISRVAEEVSNDIWYNLSGQRIDTPTRKGLYIKNGKKVVVK